MQLLSLSLIANARKGVVVLGTDCATKWRLAYFSSFDMITIQQYKCGKKCLADFASLLESSTEKGEALQIRAQQLLPTIDEETSLHNDHSELFDPSAGIHAFANQLAGLFPSERESLLPRIDHEQSNPPSMIYL